MAWEGLNLEAQHGVSCLGGTLFCWTVLAMLLYRAIWMVRDTAWDSMMGLDVYKTETLHIHET